MEEIGTINPEYHAAIVSLMAPVCAPTLEKPSPLAPIHPFTKQIVPLLYQQSLI